MSLWCVQKYENDYALPVLPSKSIHCSIRLMVASLAALSTFPGLYSSRCEAIYSCTASIQVYFRSDGTAYFFDAAYNQFDFYYNVGEWNYCVLFVDLDAAGAVYFVNDEMVGFWPWDIAGPNMLGAVNIYATADGSDDPKFYIDDFCYYPVDPIGIEDPVASEAVAAHIYPNPARDHISIKSENSIDEARIYNNMGQMVYSGEFNNNQIMVNTSNFNSGMYIVEVMVEGKKIRRKLVVE